MGLHHNSALLEFHSVQSPCSATATALLRSTLMDAANQSNVNPETHALLMFRMNPTAMFAVHV